jgi:hypothetical protein
VWSDDETRRTEELARLSSPPTDETTPTVTPTGNGNGAHDADVSQLARRLADSAAEVDAR